MPLDPIKGEVLQGLGENYQVVPAWKWRDTEFFEVAAYAAAQSFLASGAVLPIQFDELDVIVQQYPAANKLVFIFQRKMAGEEFFYPYTFDLPPQLIGELTTAGRWQPQVTN